MPRAGNEHMRISITQRGGFAGGEVVLASVDTATLDEATRRTVEQQVQAATAARQREQPVGSDMLTYELSVEDGAARSSSTWVDDGGAGAQPVKDLLERLPQVG
jgi:hypothetical protein